VGSAGSVGRDDVIGCVVGTECIGGNEMMFVVVGGDGVDCEWICVT
jgi:hypothetical protein